MNNTTLRPLSERLANGIAVAGEQLKPNKAGKKRGKNPAKGLQAKAEQRAWWAANKDALKGLAAEVQGVSTANVDADGKPCAPYKVRNAYGYDLPEWYRGDWSQKEAPGKRAGYVVKGLDHQNNELVDNNAEIGGCHEWTLTDRKKAAKRNEATWAATGCETAAPWQDALPEYKGHTYPHKGDQQTWTDTRGDLALPTWQTVVVEAKYTETEADRREGTRVLAIPQRPLADVTWVSSDPKGLARLLWTAKLRYAKQNRNPEKGARVLEAQLGNWKATGQDVWQAERELNGHLAIDSVDGAPNAGDMEEEGQYGKTGDPLDQLAWLQVIHTALRSLTPKQEEALRLRVVGERQADPSGQNLRTAQKKMAKALEG